jgi:hypothetical protein
MSDARVKGAARDVDCCDVCRWACEETGAAGTDVLSRPWIIVPVRDLVEGDVIREWGNEAPHRKATISIRDGRIMALWDEGADLLHAGSSEDVVELRPKSGGRATHVIRMLRTVTTAAAGLDDTEAGL